MVNSRAHSVGGSENIGVEGGQNNWILNQQLKKTYLAFLKAMLEKKTLSDADKMIFVYYLQLQDRIEEAI